MGERACKSGVMRKIPQRSPRTNIKWPQTNIHAMVYTAPMLTVLFLARLASAAPVQCTDTSCLEKVPGSWFGACKSCRKGCRLQVTLFGNKCIASCLNGLSIQCIRPRLYMTFQRLGGSNINFKTYIQRWNGYKINCDGAFVFCICRRVS